MVRNYFRLVIAMLSAITVCQQAYRPVSADEPKREGPWVEERAADGTLMLTGEMTLHAQGQPQPALKVRLVPDPFDMIEGNSAIYYLKAMAFLEQEGSRDRLRQITDKGRKQAVESGLTISDFPPYSWHNMPPSKLPLNEVKEYLSITSFQVPLIAEAARRTTFELERNIREFESPISYLLPEIQSLRELAKLQSLRCRVAIAEHRVDDAVKVLSQQFMLARHLGLDEFLISNLVGSAVLSIALQDAVYLLQEPDAPNLYWALANLPAPMIDMRQALSNERQFLMMQLKPLKEVDETLRPAGYWQVFIERITPRLRELTEMDGRQLTNDPDVERVALVSIIASAYPGAKRYLIEDWHMDRAEVDKYPTAQVVFLAMRRFNEQLVDEHFKWASLPYDQAVANPEFQRLGEYQSLLSAKLGWASVPSSVLITSVANIRTAQVRSQQQLALLQTIEAIRLFGKTNCNQLPQSLDALPYPAPNDPVSGKPFEYQLNGDQALLTGQRLPGLQYKFKLKLAQ